MEAIELRIGNIVRYEFKTMDIYESEYPIENGADIQVFMNNKDVFSPITLTEEWLLRLGLRKQENDNGGPFYFSDTKYFFGIYGKRSGYYILGDNGIEINYVHQLQNIHFALTGEELTIKK